MPSLQSGKPFFFCFFFLKKLYFVLCTLYHAVVANLNAKYQLTRSVICNLAINGYFHVIAVIAISIFAHNDIAVAAEKKTIEVLNLQTVVTFHQVIAEKLEKGSGLHTQISVHCTLKYRNVLNRISKSGNDC